MNMTVNDLAAKSSVLAGNAALGREVNVPQMFVPDLRTISSFKSMAAQVLHLSPDQCSYLGSLSKIERGKLARSLMKQKPACIVLSGGAVIPELLEKAEAAGIPVLKTRNLTALARLLEERLTPRVSLHGVLVEIFGLGTLIIGESAVGKSEAALDLVLRGHKLAADDVVVLEKTNDGIFGSAPELGADLLEIRGLGIINIQALYGQTATVRSSNVGLVVELDEWKKGHQYSLLGIRERRYRILGVNLPYLKLPVKPGRNMATLIEVAARNQMLKNSGIFTARDLNRKLKKRLIG